MRATKKVFSKLMSMAMVVALASSATPTTALAEEIDELSAGDLMFKAEGFITFDAEEKYYGTATPHDGIDATDETFLKDILGSWYGVESGEEFWLKGISHVTEGSTLHVSLHPDYTGSDEYYIYPHVYMLDDDGHIAYNVESTSSMKPVTSEYEYIIDFNNIDPFKPLGSMSNQSFVYDYSGKLDVEKLIYSVDVYKGLGVNEEFINCYNFMVDKGNSDTQNTPATEETTEPAENTQAQQQTTSTANGKKLEMKVNDATVVFEAYEINGNNYMKLRDLAQALTNTDKHFDVTWDNNKKVINLVSGTAYTSVGGELPYNQEQAPDFAAKTQTATLNTSMICVDGKEVSLTAYNIEGNTYFKLRDIAGTFDFGVTYDNTTKAVGVDTTQGYTE